MPLPLILAGAAVLAGGYGVKKGFDAKSDSDEAESLNSKATGIIEDAEKKLEKSRGQAQEVMEALGTNKLKIWSTSLAEFVTEFQKIKNMDLGDGYHFHESRLPEVSKNEIDKIRSIAATMSDVASGGISAIGSGGLAGLAAYGGAQALATASTGTAISALSGAAATNATLAWFGGGSLAAGGMGMAGGTAVLGGIVAGPVLAVGGMIWASKAAEAKEKAGQNFAEAKLAAEQMRTADVAAKGIAMRFEEVNSLLLRLNEYFEPAVNQLKLLIGYKQDYRSFSESEKKQAFMLLSLAMTIKNLLETPLLNEDGTLTRDSRSLVRKSTEVLVSL